MNEEKLKELEKWEENFLKRFKISIYVYAIFSLIIIALFHNKVEVLIMLNFFDTILIYLFNSFLLEYLIYTKHYFKELVMAMEKK